MSARRWTIEVQTLGNQRRRGLGGIGAYVSSTAWNSCRNVAALPILPGASGARSMRRAYRGGSHRAFRAATAGRAFAEFRSLPGGEYDRSPSAPAPVRSWLSFADGKLREGEVWRQESITGRVFEGTSEFGRQVYHDTGTLISCGGYAVARFKGPLGGDALNTPMLSGQGLTRGGLRTTSFELWRAISSSVMCESAVPAYESMQLKTGRAC